MFAKGSRYEKVPDAVFTDSDGRQIAYKLMRRIAAVAPVQQLYVVKQHDRFDLVSWRVYGNPEEFWRICDVNRGMWPDDLLAAEGTTLVIPAGR